MMDSRQRLAALERKPFGLRMRLLLPGVGVLKVASVAEDVDLGVVGIRGSSTWPLKR